MRMTCSQTFQMGGAALAAITVTTTAAMALPDLVINKKDSYYQAGGCGKDDPIATGRIAIKNQGSDTADVNVADRLTRSMLVVYVPENVDMIDKRPERQKLEPYDQQGIAFSVGEGVVKRGRNFVAPESENFATSDSNYGESEERVRAIQTALLELGYDPQGVDGRIGSRTLSAIRKFQESIGAVPTGTLTPSQQDTLFSKSGVSSSSGAGAQGETKITVYASVDPYNLVEESNEANNIWAFTVTIDCK
jgi:Putative peptidoglycan binding domain